jgi:AsmA protein
MKRALAVKCSLAHDLSTNTGSLEQDDVSIGKAVARLTGTYQAQGQTAALNMKISGSDMPIDDLAAALPALGVVLPSGSKLQGGALSLDLAIAGPASKPVITGPIRLANMKLAGFDLGSMLSAIPALGKQGGGKDTTLQSLSTTVRMAPEGTQANAINVTIPSLGVLTGAGTVSPSGALDFAMNGNLGSGSGRGVSFGIEGSTSDPTFVPDVKSITGKSVSRKVTGNEPAESRTGRFGKRRD